jgi:hypothetical protein
VSDCSRLDVVHGGVEDRVRVESSVMARSDTEAPQPQIFFLFVRLIGSYCVSVKDDQDKWDCTVIQRFQ